MSLKSLVQPHQLKCYPELKVSPLVHCESEYPFQGLSGQHAQFDMFLKSADRYSDFTSAVSSDLRMTASTH